MKSPFQLSEIAFRNLFMWLESLALLALSMHGANDRVHVWFVLTILSALWGVLVAMTAFLVHARAAPASVAALVIGIPTLGATSIEVFLRTTVAGVTAMIVQVAVLAIAVVAHLGGRPPPPIIPDARVIRR